MTIDDIVIEHKERVVIPRLGYEGPEFSKIGFVTILDNKPVYTATTKNGGGVIVVGDQISKEYDEVCFPVDLEADNSEILSIGNEPIYKTTQDDKQQIHIGEKTEKEYDYVHGDTAKILNKSLFYLAQDDSLEFPVYREKEYPKFSSIKPNSEFVLENLLGYVGRNEGKEVMVYGGVPIAEYDEILRDSTQIIDSSLCFVGKKGNKYVVNWKGTEGPKCREIMSDIEEIDSKPAYEAKFLFGKKMIIGKDVLSLKEYSMNYGKEIDSLVEEMKDMNQEMSEIVDSHNKNN